MSKYTYYIGSTQVFPLNSSSFSYIKEEDTGNFFVIDHNEELIFEYQSGAFNFKTQETTNVSEELDLIIKVRCGSTTSVYWRGVISVSEGSWDNDQCRISLKPRRKEYVLDDVIVNILEAQRVKTDEGFTPATRGIFTGSGGSSRNYTQAISFSAGVLYVATQSNPNIRSVISNFFQINPTVVSANCLPGVTNHYTAMVFCALSDIQEPIPSNLATRETITFKELMSDLNVLFDVFWFIDANYNLRIEHRTFFDGVPGLDLTTPAFEKYLKGTAKYVYSMSDYPRSETWKFANSRQFARHTYTDIGEIKTNTKEKIYNTTKLITDYANIRWLGNNSTSDGILLIATNGFAAGQFHMLESSGQNFRLSPEFLVRNIHAFDRPYFYSYFECVNVASGGDGGKFGGYIAKGIRPTKLQTAITFPLCCDQPFDVKNTVKTPMGVGYIDKASFDSKTEMMTMSLKYKVTNNIVFFPNDLSGLSVWLKQGAGMSISAGLVSQWNDASGNGRHAVQVTSGNRPSFDTGRQQVFFESGKFLEIPAMVLFPAKRGTIFVLFEKSVGNNIATCPIISNNPSVNASPLFDFSVFGDFTSSQNESALTTPTVFFYPGNDPLGPNQGLWQISRISDTLIETYHNGKRPYPFVYNPLNTTNLQIASNPVVIGDNPVSFPRTNGSFAPPVGGIFISEIIVYDRVLTDVERRKVEYYLIKKQTFGIYP